MSGRAKKRDNEKEKEFERKEGEDTRGLDVGGKKMRWKLEEIVRKVEREKKRVKIEYGRICIDDYWWKWDEKEEVLRDNKENMRLRRRGKGAEGQNWE